MIFQQLSSEGDLKELFHIDNGTTDFTDLTDFLQALSDGDVVVFFTDFVYFLTDEFFNILKPYGVNTTNGIDTSGLFANEDSRKYSQIAGVFNTKGQADMDSISPQGKVQHFLSVSYSRSLSDF